MQRKIFATWSFSEKNKIFSFEVLFHIPCPHPGGILDKSTVCPKTHSQSEQRRNQEGRFFTLFKSPSVSKGPAHSQSSLPLEAAAQRPQPQIATLRWAYVRATCTVEESRQGQACSSTLPLGPPFCQSPLPESAAICLKCPGPSCVWIDSGTNSWGPHVSLIHGSLTPWLCFGGQLLLVYRTIYV